MAHHPTGETMEILGLNQATNGCSCPDHENCGSVVKPDVVVCLRKVQVTIQGKEESAIAAYWVTDGIDSCCVGFLPKHCVRHWTLYEGRLHKSWRCTQIIQAHTRGSRITKIWDVVWPP